MVPVLSEMFVVAALGWGILTYLLTGSVGLAVVVFIVLKLVGK
jgi:hypothetical protein